MGFAMTTCEESLGSRGGQPMFQVPRRSGVDPPCGALCALCLVSKVDLHRPGVNIWGRGHLGMDPGSFRGISGDDLRVGAGTHPRQSPGR